MIGQNLTTTPYSASWCKFVPYKLAYFKLQWWLFIPLFSLLLRIIPSTGDTNTIHKGDSRNKWQRKEEFRMGTDTTCKAVTLVSIALFSALPLPILCFVLTLVFWHCIQTEAYIIEQTSIPYLFLERNVYSTDKWSDICMIRRLIRHCIH